MTIQQNKAATHHTDFLYRVAQHLYDNRKGDLSHTIVVFPNKRASLFFKEYLAEIAGVPMWLPECISINELPHRFTTLRKVDKVKAVCLLYRVYVSCLTADGKPLDPADSFDRFYGWGERLLTDFNEIDRQLPKAVAAKVFENVGEYEELNDSAIEGNDEALLAIKHFISHWEYDSNQHERERFMRLWRNLPQIHHEFKELLLTQEEGAEGYEAILWRDALNNIEEMLLTDDYNYAFVGHNALSQVEQEVLLKIKDVKKEQCLFYWDYDNRYAEDTLREAGLYIRKNLAKSGFQNALGKPEQRAMPEMDFVATSTNSVQVRYVTTWLRQLKAQYSNLDERRIAIVLCDENLLQPLLHVIPSEVEGVNITKGFPIKQTIAYRDLQEAIKHHIKDTTSDVTSFIRAINATIVQKTQATHVARQQFVGEMSASDALRALNTEAYFKVHIVLNQFESLAEAGVFENVSGGAVLSSEVLLPMVGRLLLQAVGMMSVPFHGEPICGVQIMGLLETRTLDFDHVLFVGANDGKLPLAATNNSFIPYPIRRFFGLPTAEDRIAVSAYYFNRLLHSAKHVTMLYNNSTSGNGKGEMSRFMWELLVDYKASELPVKHFTIDDKPQAISTKPLTQITKTPEMLHGLLANYENETGELNTHLSPSSLSTYITCSLKYYYSKVAKLSKPQNDEALLPANVKGTIFHAVAEDIYKPLCRKKLDVGLLEDYAKNKGNVLTNMVLQALSDDKIKAEAPQAYKDKMALDTIVQWLQTLFAYDAKQARDNNFRVHSLEDKVSITIETQIDGQPVACRVGGTIDRLDQVTINGKETWRIFDYKTGKYDKSSTKSPDSFKDIEELFTFPNYKRYVSQTFLYAYILKRQQKYNVGTLAPALFFLSQGKDENYEPYIKQCVSRGENKPIYDFSEYDKAVGEGLQKLIDEMFDISKSFEMTKDSNQCKNCDFKSLCQR